MYDKGRLLLPREIARICYKAGWIDALRLVDAVAVVLAESNGYAKRRGPEHIVNGVLTYGNTDGSYDRGMWQINTVHKDISDAATDDPVKATAYARKLYLDRGFRPWAAYTSGRYKNERTFVYAIDGVRNFLAETNGMPLK